MTATTRPVKLRKILQRSTESVRIDPKETYQQITVKLWGQGVVQRNEVLGSEIAAEQRFVARAGQFILSRIDARNGAIGIVPEELDGAIVSNDFPLFDIDTSKILPKYLAWFSKTQQFVGLCKQASEGTTNRVRLQEDRFLASEILLPLLEKQRRIVARIEELASRIEEGRKLCQDFNHDVDDLCRSILFSESNVTVTPMRELVTLRSQDVVVQPDRSYDFAGVYSFGRGVFRGQTKKGSEFSYTRLTRLRADDFVYPKLMAWEGALGVVPPECDQLVVSPEFPVFEVNQKKALPETLDVYFKIPSVWRDFSNTSTGTNVRRRRLQPSDFLNYLFPLPSWKTQLYLRDVKQKANIIKTHQAELQTELEILLPVILDRAIRGEL